MIQVIAIHDLTDEHEREWTELMTVNPAHRNGFLSPVFARVVEAHRPGVQVAVIRKERGVAYLAFERAGKRTARACGLGISDMQGAVGEFDPAWWPEVLEAMDVEVFDFDHLMADQAPAGCRVEYAPVVELSDGYEAYEEALQARHKKRIKSYDRKERGLIAEVGEYEFTYDDQRESTLAAIGRWKSAQYKRSGYADLFAQDWYVAVLKDLLATPRSQCFGVSASSLSVDGKVIAAQLNVVGNSVMSGWVTAFDRDYSKYSPGIVMLRHTLQQASASGITTYEFGKGDEGFKQDFKTGDVGVVTAWIRRPGVASALFWLRREPRRRLELFILDRPELRLRVRKIVASLGRFRR